MPQAFVSYAREDKAFIDEHVRPVLNALNVDMWIDTEDLHGAERWKETIQRAMPECDYFLLVVTTTAAASPAVRAEVEWVLKNRTERLIPILAGRTRLDGIHPDLPSIQHVDCVDKPKGKAAVLIARALINLADRRLKNLEIRNAQLSEAVEEKQEQLARRG